jgi:leucyl aminopeptidase
MEIQVIKGDILKQSADLLVMGTYEQENTQNPFMETLNEALHGKLLKRMKVGKFEGKVGQQLLLPAPDMMDVDYVLIVGLGPVKEGAVNAARQAAGITVQTAKKLGLSTIAMEFLGEDDDNFDARAVAQGMIEALLLADYDFTLYKEETDEPMITSVTIVAEDGRDVRKAQRIMDDTFHITDGVNVARDLVNTPAGDMTPTRLAEAAKEIAKTSEHINVKILDRKACEKLKMGSYLSVSEGSDEPPQFIHLTYTPTKKAKKKVVLVGKGVTFDSGGLSIKPSNGMMTMKADMAGSATVLGLFAALGRLQPNIEVHGIIAATENMINGKATRPGDIVRASNGKTIEVLNTDAEGRLTLADALHYAAALNPDYTIDLATLTGACVVALGEEIAALHGNDEGLNTKILEAAKQSDEDMWLMPLPSRYNAQIKSDVADLRNIAKTRYGGSLTAALFLQNFVAEGMKWAHMDIAGPAFAERPIGSYLKKGGTGYGVRTLARFLKNL